MPLNSQDPSSSRNRISQNSEAKTAAKEGVRDPRCRTRREGLPMGSDHSGSPGPSGGPGLRAHEAGVPEAAAAGEVDCD